MSRFLYLLLFLTTVFVHGQQTDYVNFKTANAIIKFEQNASKVMGVVRYNFEIIKAVDSVYLDALQMNFDKVTLNERIVDYKNDSNKLWIKHPFKGNTHYEVSFNFEATPKKAMYFIDWDFNNGNKQIWTQGQGKYTSNWLPSIDDMNDKIEFDLNLTFDENYEVIANGKLINKKTETGFTTWHYDMQKPMSSYLVALAIGKYSKKVAVSKSGIPLEMYYYPDDSLKFEPTYRYTKKMFDFLEEEIGVPYPWQNYKQIPVKDFLYAGMENTTATIFADSFVIDSVAFIDKNYVNVNAHELAHQWFGNLVTETSGTHHWLQEGFATYYAVLAEKSVFGNNYYYWQLYQYAQELLKQDEAGESTKLLDPKSSSTTFYKKGALLLYMLREKVGDKNFKKAVENYVLKHQFKNVETYDFIREVEKVSRVKLTNFVKIWLESTKFDYEAVIESLKKSTFIVDYLKVNCNVDNIKCKSYLTSKISDEAKIKVIEQNPKLIDNTAFKNSLKVRQAIAINLVEISSELKSSYETLLSDASYETVNKALYHLWLNFPEQRIEYLNKTKGMIGFNDKNIRILWLTLALVTENFETEHKQSYFEELTNYTNPVYNFEIRQNAFLYLQEINACKEVCIENLKQASKHHNWRFSSFAKSVLDQINVKN